MTIGHACTNLSPKLAEDTIAGMVAIFEKISLTHLGP